MYILSQSSCVRSRQNGQCEDLSKFDKDQIVMARRLGQSISKTWLLWSAPIYSGQFVSKAVQGRNSGELWVFDARGE